MKKNLFEFTLHVSSTGFMKENPDFHGFFSVVDMAQQMSNDLHSGIAIAVRQAIVD
ncbi:MAG: hypothetical protein OXC84_10205 [Gammaproteobacteria bacterium]|nr:hypothetical protein [Gammaproteobacteria bacterium]